MRLIYGLIIISLVLSTYGLAEVTYGGGDGTSVGDAVIIENAADHYEGVNAEYIWLEMQFGPQGEKWERDLQSLVEEGDRLYDVLKVEFYEDVAGHKKGDVTYFYFDITEFFMNSMEELFKE